MQDPQPQSTETQGTKPQGTIIAISVPPEFHHLPPIHRYQRFNVSDQIQNLRVQ